VHHDISGDRVRVVHSSRSIGRSGCDYPFATFFIAFGIVFAIEACLSAVQVAGHPLLCASIG
jgi:hypothetical protein